MLVTRMVTKIVDANWCSMDRKDSGRDFDRAIGGGGVLLGYDFVQF
jgi:hypothetical protein